MKRFMMVLMLVIMIAVASSAMAAGSIAPTVSVAGTVTGKCDIVNGTGAMEFTIDPSASGTVLANVTSSPVIKCTKSYPYTVACTSANAFKLVNGSDSIPYTFTCPSGGNGAGYGSGNNITMAIGGEVSTGFVDAPAGSYADVVTITVNY